MKQILLPIYCLGDIIVQIKMFRNEVQKNDIIDAQIYL